MHAFALWVKSTDLSWLVTHYGWVWATCEALHFIGHVHLVRVHRGIGRADAGVVEVRLRSQG